MTFYSILALSCFLLTLLGTRLTILAFRKRPIPIDPASLRPGYRKPPLANGGLATVMALIICLLVADINYAIILAMFMLAAMSLLDELIPIPLPVRLLVQLLSVLIAINVVGVPVFGGFFPPAVDKVITTLLMLWFLNLFKLMDGVDGISPMEMIGIGMGVCLMSGLTGRVFPNPLAVYGLIVGAAGCAFIWWNWYPAKVLLGEVGSVPIGFLLAYLLLLTATSGYPYAAVILPAYHISDATLTMIRRVARGRKLLATYNDFYYFRAMRAGRRPDAVVRYMFGLNFLLLFQAVFSVIDPTLAIFYVGMAYASVFMILGFFAHTAHDSTEPF